MKRFRVLDEEEIRRIDRLQAEYFSEIQQLFDPPLPEGVPERLQKIVESAGIRPTDTVLDIGTGTGILIPLIEAVHPARIYANDLSASMLESLRLRHPGVITLEGDIRDLDLPDRSIDVAFMNACYPNIVDKERAFTNLGRMMRPGGRLVISHPLGRHFIGTLKEKVPFPLDEFPATRDEAEELFAAYGFRPFLFTDEANLYMLGLERTGGTEAGGTDEPGEEQGAPS